MENKNQGFYIPNNYNTLYKQVKQIWLAYLLITIKRMINIQEILHIFEPLYGDALGVMVIIIGNGIGKFFLFFNSCLNKMF